MRLTYKDEHKSIMRPDGLPFVVRRSRRIIQKVVRLDASMRLVPVFKGTLRSNDATAMRTSLKNEFAIFQSLSQLFLPTYFVKCRRTLLELNSYGPYAQKEKLNFVVACLRPP